MSQYSIEIEGKLHRAKHRLPDGTASRCQRMILDVMCRLHNIVLKCSHMLKKINTGYCLRSECSLRNREKLPTIRKLMADISLFRREISLLQRISTSKLFRVQRFCFQRSRGICVILCHSDKVVSLTRKSPGVAAVVPLGGGR